MIDCFEMLQVVEEDTPLSGAWRALQGLLGSPEARSSAEQQEVERAANREPWVHEVGVPCASFCRCAAHALQLCCVDRAQPTPMPCCIDTEWDTLTVHGVCSTPSI